MRKILFYCVIVFFCNLNNTFSQDTIMLVGKVCFVDEMFNNISTIRDPGYDYLLLIKVSKPDTCFSYIVAKYHSENKFDDNNKELKFVITINKNKIKQFDLSNNLKRPVCERQLLSCYDYETYYEVIQIKKVVFGRW